MTRVTIEEVEQRQHTPRGLLGCSIDGPKGGAASATYSFELVGWALAEAGPLTRVEALQEGRVVAAAEPGEAREDIAAAFSDTAHAGACGFRLPVGTLDLRREFELSVVVWREEGVRTEIATVRGSRTALPAAGEELIQPLMVNTIGRSGSTWLVWVLSCLAESVCVSPWSSDARVGSYWASVLQTLARPQSYLAQLEPGPIGQPSWWYDRPDLKFGMGGAPALEGWLGGAAVDELTALCSERIETFYARLAEPGAAPRYFVEKFLPHQVVPDLLAEIYPGAREVVLVRDFRDILCSVIAFNRKRGWDAFGRSKAGSDEEYVETVLLSSAEWLKRRLDQRGDSIHLVRYEDLIEEPAATLGGMMRYLGLDADEEKAAAVAERAERDAPVVDEHRTSEKVSASVGRWRRDLPPELVRACAEVLDPVLVQFGYEPTSAVASES
ncbi:MAG TPA: sulfotransferase [Solirubrobacterales bacterium]|jgi:hypothetical protein|nr:sulfotransferase [Solirubrobacterales bacterium]